MKWWQKQQELVQSNEQQRAEKLLELGSILRQKRQERNLSLAQVATQTRIRLHYLEAIEAGNLDELPEAIYIQGFIKQYAEVLGLNGTELASSFPSSDRLPNLKPVGISLPAAQFQTSHLYLLYIFVVVCTVSALSQTLQQSEVQVSKSRIPERNIAPIEPKTTAQQNQKVQPVSATPNPPSKTNKSVEVGVTVKAESWVRVTADGKKQFEGLLPQGTQRTWVAKEQLTVRVGNAGGVLVTFNETAAKPLGQLGEVRDVTFAADRQL